MLQDKKKSLYYYSFRVEKLLFIDHAFLYLVTKLAVTEFVIEKIMLIFICSHRTNSN